MSERRSATGLKLRIARIGYEEAILVAVCFLWILQTIGLIVSEIQFSYPAFDLVSRSDYSYESVREQDDWYKFIKFCEQAISSNSVYLFQGDWDRGHTLRYYLYPRVYVDGRDLHDDAAILQRIKAESVTHVIVGDKATLAYSRLLNDAKLFTRVDYNTEQAILVVNRDALEDAP